MNFKSLFFPALAAIVAGLLVHYFLPRIETKTVTQTRTVVQTDVRTITKIVERPDGTKETTIDSTDRSTKNASKSKVSTKYSTKNWHISAAYLTDFTAKEVPVYQIEAQMRILGPFYAGALLSSEHKVGLVIGLEF
jgi:uncharacterized membrane protein YhiD involved in acid resistance